jgi:hypothetical protein
MLHRVDGGTLLGRSSVMALRLKKRSSVDDEAATPPAVETLAAEVVAPRTAGRSRSAAASRPSMPGIFSALETARANMLESDASLARARKILG